MSDDRLYEQSVEIERLLPTIMRRLFTLLPGHPTIDLPVAQLRVCSILQAGSRTLSALSAELGISISAVAQLTDRLENAGMVERIPGAEDRRTRHIQLTLLGAQLMQERRAARVARAEKALELLAPEEREETLAILRRLLHAAKEAAPPMQHEDPITIRQEI